MSFVHVHQVNKIPFTHQNENINNQSKARVYWQRALQTTEDRPDLIDSTATQ